MDIFNLSGRSFHLLGNLEDDVFGEKTWQTQKDVRCGWCRAWQSLWGGVSVCTCRHGMLHSDGGEELGLLTRVKSGVANRCTI